MSNGLAASLPGPRAVLQGSRALRWTIGVGVAAVAGVGLVLLFLLTQATNNRELYERNYARLFTLNVVVATVLLLVIIWITARLLLRLRQKRFGSRLLVKLAAISTPASTWGGSRWRLWAATWRTKRAPQRVSCRRCPTPVRRCRWSDCASNWVPAMSSCFPDRGS